MKILLAAALFALPAFADCTVRNDTRYDFDVDSGAATKQAVASHTKVQIASGKITGMSKKGKKQLSGNCKDGENIQIKEERGTIMLMSVE
jgi:hypothetical protein